MSDEKIEPAIEKAMRTGSMEVTDEWATAIGWCAIHFGNIEHFTQTVLVYLASEQLAESVKRLYLSDRLRVLDAFLQSFGLTQWEAARWSAIYKQVEKLKDDYRNPLAHGAPLPFIFEQMDGRIVSGVQHSTHRNPARTLTLEQIQAAAEDIRAAHIEFDQTLLEIVTRLNNEGRVPPFKK